MYVGGLHFYVSPSHLQKCICFFLYPLLRRRCYLSQKLWNFFVNELRRLSVSNLVEVFFIIHIASHIYPISGCLGRNKIRGLNFHYPPYPLPSRSSRPPFSSITTVRLDFAGGWRSGSWVKASISLYLAWIAIVIGSQRKEINWIFDTAAMAES